jgi:hypothetical protein
LHASSLMDSALSDAKTSSHTMVTQVALLCEPLTEYGASR